MINIRKIHVLSIIAVLTFTTQAAAQVGMILEIQGDVNITRSGTQLAYLDIGDTVYNFDLIRTGNNGIAVIDIFPESGMEGSISIMPSSVFTIKMEQVRNETHTEANLLGGSVGLKVKKLSGDPALRVRSGSTVMGVRGTEFTIHISVNDSLLVSCTEGKVNCSEDDGISLDAVPGQLVQKESGKPLRLVPVALSDLETYTAAWYAEEISAFRAAPVLVLDQYATAYTRHLEDFRKASDALSAHPVFNKWKQEQQRGVTPRSMDPQVMNEKSRMLPVLTPLRRILFFFEKTYYRLEEVESYIPSSALSSRLSSGRSVQDFLRQLRAERSELLRRTAEYRHALYLFAERNDGREPVSLDQQGSGGFFDSLDSFFD